MAWHQTPTWQRSPAIDDHLDRRDVIAAWIVIILVLSASVVGFVLDRAATLAP
jgi:hypothetical protein